MPDASAATSPLDRQTWIAVSPDAVSADLEAETIILGMKDGVYYGLDAVGSRIWALVAAPTSLGALVDTVTREYDVMPDVAWSDLLVLVQELLAAGLVERVPPPAA